MMSLQQPIGHIRDCVTQPRPCMTILFAEPTCMDRFQYLLFQFERISLWVVGGADSARLQLIVNQIENLFFASFRLIEASLRKPCSKYWSKTRTATRPLLVEMRLSPARWGPCLPVGQSILVGDLLHIRNYWGIVRKFEPQLERPYSFRFSSDILNWPGDRLCVGAPFLPSSSPLPKSVCIIGEINYLYEGTECITWSPSLIVYLEYPRVSQKETTIFSADL